MVEHEIEIETTNSDNGSDTAGGIPDNFNLRDELKRLKVMANYAAEKGLSNLYKTVCDFLCECEKVWMNSKMTEKLIKDVFTN